MHTICRLSQQCFLSIYIILITINVHGDDGRNVGVVK
jgi:hypothetical protein